MKLLFLRLGLPLLAAALASCSSTTTIPAVASAATANVDGTPQLRHVFVLILENQAEDNTFGSLMPVPYLQNTVSAQGAFIPNYWGTSHFSLGNYVSFISGMSATTQNQGDCTTYTQILNSTTIAYNQVSGNGCVYPSTTITLADQLVAAHFSWRGYMEDMGNDGTREGATCGQTQPTASSGTYGFPDLTLSAQPASSGHPQDQYAERHNPFVYFTSLLSSGSCLKNVVPLSDATLTNDLKSIATVQGAGHQRHDRLDVRQRKRLPTQVGADHHAFAGFPEGRLVDDYVRRVEPREEPDGRHGHDVRRHLVLLGILRSRSQYAHAGDPAQLGVRRHHRRIGRR
jgi:hypothetical protein